jgi:outer membrane protein assembly factor BamB
MSMPMNRSGLRLWPAWVILLIQAGAITYSLTAEFDNFSRFVAMMAGPLLCLVLFLVFWLGFSRLPSRYKWGLLGVSVLSAAIVGVLIHSSVRSAMWIYGVPLSMVLATLGLHFFSGRSFRAMATLLIAGWLPFLPARLDGFDGSYFPEFSWRWSPTLEERSAMAREKSPAAPVAPLSLADEVASTDWPGFRGSQRDSRVRSVTIRADWSKKPPQEVWRIPVGPGWSSFAVVGDWLFTQEQMGADEAVVCYSAATGKEVWRSVERARFEEIVAGPGPRATPTYAAGKILAQGAMGHVHCLDAKTGKVLWKHDLMEELGARLPEWGFSGSPLVVDGLAIVFADGKDKQGLIAYKVEDGPQAWRILCPGMNFSSAQLMSMGEKTCVVFAAGEEIVCLEAASGQPLFKYRPQGWRAAPMVQPQQLDDRSLVVALGDGVGTTRLVVNTASEAWTVREEWSSKALKPAFNDYVYFQRNLYGFDQNIFTCVNAETGDRQWKKGRYGFGQVLLFEEQGLLVILAESGEIVLLKCDPKENRELGRLAVLDGKTWNHPAFAAGRLYVRNGAEAVCLDLSP